MNNTLENELRSMYRRHGSHLPTQGPGLELANRVTVQNHSPEQRGHRVLVAAVSIAVLGSAAGLWAMSQRPIESADSIDSVPSTSGSSSPSSSAVFTPGRWTMDVPPVGLKLTNVSDGRPSAGSDHYVTRIYASTSVTPERGPFVVLLSYPDDVGSPSIPNDATSVDVGGFAGTQWTKSGRNVIVVQRDGFWYQMETSRIANAVALATTAQQALDGSGAVIDDSLLPSGVLPLGVGSVEEVRFLTTSALANPIPNAHWETTSRDAGVFYESIVESPAQFPLHRVEYPYTSITDIVVNGHPATTLVGDRFVTVTWNDGQRTMIVTGYNVEADVVLTAATALRPASDAEWQLMEASAVQAQVGAPTATTVTVGG